MPWNTGLSVPPLWKSPGASRPIDLSGRFATEYDRYTVEHHRKSAVSAFEGRFDPSFVTPRKYWAELRQSKIVLSPFGFGEVCFRDFEALLSGNVILKPSMSHLETWPPVFDAGETYVEVPWDFEGGSATLDSILSAYDEYRTIAETAQNRYREYLLGETARQAFITHFESILPI